MTIAEMKALPVGAEVVKDGTVRVKIGDCRDYRLCAFQRKGKHKPTVGRIVYLYAHQIEEPQ